MAADAYLELAATHREQMIVEGAGLFWLAAEVVILAVVAAGRRHLETEPLPARFALGARGLRQLAAGAAAMLALSALVYGRHWVWPPAAAHVTPAGAIAGLSPEAFRAVVHARTHAHLVLWAVFVLGWVLLEAAIVYQGWRGYRRLRAMLRAQGADS